MKMEKSHLKHGDSGGICLGTMYPGSTKFFLSDPHLLTTKDSDTVLLKESNDAVYITPSWLWDYHISITTQNLDAKISCLGAEEIAWK